MKFQNKLLSELKEIAKKKKIKGYSKLNKKELIQELEKIKQKGGGLLPYRIRYSFSKKNKFTDNAKLKNAVNLWCSNK